MTKTDNPKEPPGGKKSARQAKAVVKSSVDATEKTGKLAAEKTSAQAGKAKTAAAKKPGAKPAASAPPPKFVIEPKPLEAPSAPTAATTPEKFGIRIIHRVPGRTRVELRQMKQNNALAKKVEERLIVVPGILAVETSTITGRAVMYYNPAVFSQPSALQDLQNAWQDLFPGMPTDKLASAMISQQPH